MTNDVIKTPARPAWAEQLTDKEMLFVEAYLSTLNATQAALAAGFAKSRISWPGTFADAAKSTYRKRLANAFIESSGFSAAGRRLNLSKATVSDQVCGRWKTRLACAC